jgi:ankyrin repeat protein
VRSGHVGAITALISAGASVKARDDDGRTAIFSAAELGLVKAIESLHALGADLSSRDNRGSTPLFLAAANAYVAAVEKLIELGADLNCKNYNGETPWSYAKLKLSNPPPELKLALNRKRPSNSGLWSATKGLLGRRSN